MKTVCCPNCETEFSIPDYRGKATREYKLPEMYLGALPLDVLSIINKLCSFFNAKPEDIISGKKADKQTTSVRHWCIYFVLVNLDYTKSRVGKFFNFQNHTSVMHVEEKIRNLCDVYETERNKKDMLKLFLNSFS